MFEQTIKLIGKPLNDPELQAFMNEHGFKQPKRTEISGTSSESSFWVEHKKLGINFLFDIETNRPLYPPVAGSKKNLWVPILHYVTFLNTKLAYPMGLKLGLTHDETTKLLGAPSYKSSDISKIWLNDDGSESFYGWNKTIDEAKQVGLHARIKKDDKLDEINVHIIELKEIIGLFDVFSGKTLSLFLAHPHNYNYTFLFMEWAIKHDLYIGQTSEQAGVAAVKNGLSMHDFFQQYIKTSAIYLEFFAPAQQQFVRQYIDNMSTHDVYFGRDYSLSFLSNKAERENYLGDDALNTLAKVELNDANKAKIFAVLDARFAEFNAHGFAKSTVELKY
jgi:hypothetical protein